MALWKKERSVTVALKLSVPTIAVATPKRASLKMERSVTTPTSFVVISASFRLLRQNADPLLAPVISIFTAPVTHQYVPVSVPRPTVKSVS